MTENVLAGESLPSGEAAPETPETEPVDTGTTPDVAEDSAPETEGTEDKPKGGFQRRIKELVDERNDERRRAEQYQRRLDYVLERMLEREQPAAAPEPPVPATPPKLEDFQYDEAQHRAALDKWVAAQAKAVAQSEIQQWQAQQVQAARVRQFQAREAEFAAAKADYRTLVYDDTLPITAAMAEIIQESDVGPALAYELAKDRDKLAALARLPERQMARELGRLEAKLTTAPPPPPARPAVSQAPPPPPKVQATEPEIEQDPDKLPMDQWLKWREKQIRKRQGR